MKLNLLRFFLVAALALLCQPAFADKRVALVLGNSAYQNVPRLTNPINDSALIAAKLKEAGFDMVTSRHDLTALETRRALRDFEDSARNADIAVIYYAGHGIEVDGVNYLVPVDAKLVRDSDVYDEALSLERVLFALEPATKLRLVILDACRDNPFAQTMKRTLASRSIGRGLAKVEPSSPNTLIAYSAKAGSTAQDGEGKDSPFTIALANHLTTPGLDVRKAFGFVRDDVLKSTGNRQEPFVYGSLGGDDVPLVPAPAAYPPDGQVSSSPQADARRDYELAMQVGTKDALEAFLAQYPDGFYASLARSQLEKITAEAARTASGKAQPAPVVAERKGSEMAADASPSASSATQPAPSQSVSVAALSTGPPATDITKSVQLELHRVGCLNADVDGKWGAASQRSLSQFNRYAGTKLDTKVATSDALDAIKQAQSRVCPLVCEHGFRAEGDHCTRIACAEGTFLNDDNECVKSRGKTRAAKRDSYERPVTQSQKPQAAARTQAPRSSGQIICDGSLCRAVRPGCHLEANSSYALKGSGGTAEICN